MPSIDSRSIAEQLIRDQGCFEDDPPACAVYEYTTQWGGTCYFVAYDDSDLLALAHGMLCCTVQNPRLLWGRSVHAAIEASRAADRLLSSLDKKR